jgi:small multidrug resistance family-3 protein
MLDKFRMRDVLDQIVANRTGALMVLLMAAFLEAYGDSCFQAGLYRSSGASRALALLVGAASLASYGLVVNMPRWDFGRLLGVYVVLFFLCAQVIAWVKFGQRPSFAVMAGGALITAGGLIISIFGS